MKGRFSKGNRKLSKGILIWNLPRLTTCPGAGSCKDWCYEIKIERMYPNTLPFRQHNLALSKQQNFDLDVVNYLMFHPCRDIRVHESGDFYDQEYLDKWKKIAYLLPTKNFYAYTKSLHLDLWTDLPDNFNILQSFGGKWDNLIDYSKPTFRVCDIPISTFVAETPCPFYTTGGKCGDACRICIEDTSCHVTVALH